jgi:hypothetical protein
MPQYTTNPNRNKTMSQYPEHDKLQTVSDKSQVIGEFIEWLTSEKIELCKWQESRNDEHAFTPSGFYTWLASTEEILAKYFNINTQKLETEKRQMLAELQKQA